MPLGPMHTKKQKAAGMEQVMHEYKHGKLHSGSKHGPEVKNRKQAVAIALKQTGQSKYDRSAHEPGNPGFGRDREGKPPYRNYDAGAHAKQPHGKSIGIHDPGVNQKQHTQFEAETREHKGGIANREGDTRSHGGEIANTGQADRGSELVEQCGAGHATQHHGHSIGTGSDGSGSKIGMAHHHTGTSMGGATHCFPGTHKQGYLRVSGQAGAHQIGKRK